MNYLASSEPIIACSSGNVTNTAISIIRLSGFKDINSFLICFSLKEFKPRYSHFCKLIDSNNKILDEVLVTYFPGPNSYNGENILELSVHGNKLNVDKIIDFFCTNFGFTIAGPGEFTYRALKNKKLSLSQVEGLDLLLNANSDFIISQGFSLLSGKLQDAYKDLYKAFLNHKSALELSIDFLEDIGEEASQRNLNDSLNSLGQKISNLKQRVINTKFDIITPSIVLYGDPNSGKSSLFNKLLSTDRSIVTEIAGTTRDYITESIKFSDIYFDLIDTAGIRTTTDKIEEEGVNRSKNLVNKAFVKILLINLNDFDKANIELNLQFNPDIILFTHNDLILNIDPFFIDSFGSIEPKKSGPIEPKKSGPIEPLLYSINLFDSLDHFYELLNTYAVNKYTNFVDKNPISIERHKNLILDINEKFINYSNLSAHENDISILSSELYTLENCISELIGIVSPDDVLHNIFDNFCIGK